MDTEIKLFEEARNHLMQTVQKKVEVYLTGMWDPHIKYVIIRETLNLIHRELEELFPTLPPKYFPQCKFRIFEEEKHIEVGIQNYLNRETDLKFLGTNDISSTSFDYYMRDSWDPMFDYIFTARYGHDYECEHRGSKTAEVEYFMGVITPLSVAYGMAVEDGFIS